MKKAEVRPFLLIFALLLIGTDLFISTTSSLESLESSESEGATRSSDKTKQIMIEWSESRGAWGSADPAKIINVSKQILATDLILIMKVGQMPKYLDQYIAAGFGVYICLGPVEGGVEFPKPADIEPYLDMPIKGIMMDYLFPRDKYPPSQTESNLKTLAASCKSANKELAYYHGDGALYINAPNVAADCIVCDQWIPEAKYPYR